MKSDENFQNDDENKETGKPKLLQAIELVLADPKDIKLQVNNLLEKYNQKYSNKKNTDEIQNLVAKKIISNYSYFTSFIGGATALTGVIPGLGEVIAAFGGAAADAALTMKYQIEMTMALAVVYNHDIELEEEKRLCFLIAGLGTINEAAKEGGKEIGSKAFKKLVEKYIQGSLLQSIKEIFKEVGLVFTRKALVKAIPFGVGVIIGASANKGVTLYVGNKAKDFFKTN